MNFDFSKHCWACLGMPCACTCNLSCYAHFNSVELEWQHCSMYTKWPRFKFTGVVLWPYIQNIVYLEKTRHFIHLRERLIDTTTSIAKQCLVRYQMLLSHVSAMNEGLIEVYWTLYITRRGFLFEHIISNICLHIF